MVLLRYVGFRELLQLSHLDVSSGFSKTAKPAKILGPFFL